jgi:Xaa-Pro aminopeptidase
MNDVDQTKSCSRARQQRLLEVIKRERLDLVVVCRHEHVQWLAGPRFHWTFEPAAAITADGHVTLVAPAVTHRDAAADQIVAYQSNKYGTLRNDQRRASAETLLSAIGRRAKARRVGVEFSSCGPHLSSRFDAELVDIEPALYRLRRRKEPDELARLRKAIDATGAMYARGREIIRPGANELKVFNQLQAVAVEQFGEMMTATGNDYQSGTRGGPPRNRSAEAGELYILDLGPAYQGYFADNSRAVAVDRKPSDEQSRACEKICEVFPMIERSVKPGVRCREIFNAAQQILDEYRPGAFDHHLGHGIGLYPHEAPHLNPQWDDTFEVGDVFTAEPGLYGPELRAGIRLENDYLVTERGVELLSDFPLGLC